MVVVLVVLVIPVSQHVLLTYSFLTYRDLSGGEKDASWYKDTTNLGVQPCGKDSAGE